MGALNSIHNKLKEFSEVEEEDGQNYSTPEKTLRHKCLAGVDPRSPTEEIDRTPIIVEGTPNVLSKGMKSRIPSQNVGPIDPRSPSSEFTRTPLSLGQPSCEGSSTPLKAPSCFIPPPSLQDLDFKVSDDSAQDRLPKEQELSDIVNQSSSYSDNNNTSTLEESLEESYDTAPLLDSAEKLQLLSIQDEKKTNSTSGQETESEDSFSSHCKPKCRPVNRILSQNIPVSKPKVRSALTLVENSTRVSRLPKKIVSTSGGKTKHKQVNNSVAVDKENICH